MKIDKNSKGFLGTFLIFLFILSILSVVLSIFVGSVDIKPIWVIKIIINNIAKSEFFPVEWKNSANSIVWQLRFPKVIVAFITGAGLSLTGLLMQSLTKNPLADPYVLGISSGASTGAVATILLGSLPFLGRVPISLGAFIGSILASILVYIGSASFGGLSTSNIVLIGMSLSAIFSAFTNIIIFLTPKSHAIKNALYWLGGSLSGVTWADVPLFVVTFIIMFIAMFILSKSLDLLLLGEDMARTNGVPIFAIKTAIIVLSTLITAVLVSTCGIIGFVGLIVPHLGRIFVGSAHKKLVPVCVFLGGILMIWSDVFARVYFSPEELPVGVITALIGAPIFLFLLKSSYKKVGR